MLETPTDAELVRLCLAGRQEGYARLLDRHKGRVYGFLLRFVGADDAEDLAQQTFLKAFRALASYDVARPFPSWLFAVAHRTALDFLRARRPADLSLDDQDAPPEPADTAQGPEDAAEAALDGELVERLLAALPPLYREVLLLRHAEGLEVARIAEALSLPEGTVKIRLFRARELMRAKWEAVAGEKMKPAGPGGRNHG